jgi:hypothetical protein
MKILTYHIKIFVLFATLLSTQNTIAQAVNAHRGLYVDDFALADAGGNLIPGFSILGQSSKEDSLLHFCKENHITYITLYGLNQVLDNNPVDSHKDSLLMNFILKARRNFGITEIGAALGSNAAVNRIDTYQRYLFPTAAYTFTGAELNSGFYYQLKFVENNYIQGTDSFAIAELTKEFLNISRFNRLFTVTNDSAKFDVLNLEFEFWNKNTLADFPSNYTLDSLYIRVAKPVMLSMARVRNMNNAISTNRKLKTEIYLGSITKNTGANTPTAIATFIDGLDTVGSNRRLMDRILLHYYNTNPDTVFKRSDYYARYQTFRKAATLDSTLIHPIFSGASKELGYGEDHFGVWFDFSNRNNIFTAEKDWFHDVRIDSTLLVNKNIFEFGGAQWYTRDVLVSKKASPQVLNHTNTFYTNSPVNTYGAATGSVTFTYSGPIEAGIVAKLIIFNSSNARIDSASFTTATFAGGIYTIKTSTLSTGLYTATLKLDYGNGYSYTYKEPVVVLGTPTVVSTGATTFCDGGGVILKSSEVKYKTSIATNKLTYHWYRNNILLATSYNKSVQYYYATLPGYYKCRIDTNSNQTSLFTDSILINVLSNPIPYIYESNLTNGAARTLTAKPNTAGNTYAWDNGAISDSIAITQYDKYDVLVITSQGCQRRASVTIGQLICGASTYPYSSDTLSSHFALSSGYRNTFAIKNNFHFDSNFSIDSSLFVAANNAKMVVDSGYTLTVKRTSTVKGCTKLWKGIEVKQGAKIEQLTNSKIEDALYGIHLLNGSDFNINKATYNKNYVGIYVQGFSHNSSTSNSWIKTCTFDCANGNTITNLLPADTILISQIGNKPLAGILANGGKLFVNLNDSLNITTFKNMSNGIIARNNSYVVEHYSKFKNIHADNSYNNIVPFGNGSGFLATNNMPMYVPRVIGRNNSSVIDFQNCDFGAYSFNSSIDVYFNKMDTVLEGIHINAIMPLSTHRSLIQQNTINAKQKGIFIANADSSHANVILNNTVSIGLFNGIAGSMCGIDINSSSTTSYPDTSLKVIGNTVKCYQAGFGIRSINAKNGIIKDNLVKLQNIASSTGSTGIMLHGAKGSLLENNLIKGNYNGTDSSQTAISINMCDSIKFACNQTDSTAMGIVVAGNNYKTDFRTNGTGFSKYGLFLSGSGILGDERNKGNIFGNQYEKFAACNKGNPNLSTFYSDSAFKKYYPDTSRIYPSTGWFVPDAAAADTCFLTSIYIPYHTRGGTYQPTEVTGAAERLIASGNVNATEFPTETQYMAEQNLLERISLRPTLLNDSVLADYYSSHYNSSMSELINLKKMQSAYPSDVLIARNQLSIAEFNLSQTEINFSANQHLIDSLGYSENLLRASDSLQSLRDAQTNEYTLKREIYYANYNDFIQSLKEINDGITITNLIEQNEQLVNTIYFETFARAIFNLTQIQHDLLLSVAQQCPFAGGTAVYRARAILAAIDNTLVFEDVNYCTQLGFYRKKNEEIKQKLVEQAKFSVFPNPANDNLIVFSNADNFDIKIIDNLGKMIYLNKTENSFVKNISTSSFANGVYFISIQNSNGMSTKKIIVIH